MPIWTGTESSSTSAVQPCSPPSLLSPVPPTIADDLTDVVVTRLSPAVLTCYASGVPPPTVSWSKDGAQLGSRGGGYRVLPRGTARGSTAPAGTGHPCQPSRRLPSACCFPGALEIRQALPAHSGHYTCTARSAAGMARKHLRLTVHGMHGSRVLLLRVLCSLPIHSNGALPYSSQNPLP